MASNDKWMREAEAALEVRRDRDRLAARLAEVERLREQEKSDSFDRGYNSAVVNSSDAIDRLRSERDAAIREREGIRRCLARELHENVPAYAAELEKLTAERDAARGEVERLERVAAEEKRLSEARLQGQLDLMTERDRHKAAAARLTERQSELLATIVRLTNETPFSDEAKDALEQRGKLVAEIGTLRSEVERLKMINGEIWAENEWLVPVWQAARKWREAKRDTGWLVAPDDELARAVDASEKQEGQ